MEKELMEELNSKIKPKSEADISLEFLEEYKKLTRKYKRDFVQGEIHIIKVDFIE